MRRRFGVTLPEGHPAPDGTSTGRSAVMRTVRQAGAALSVAGTVLLAGGLLSYGASGDAIPASVPGHVVVAAAATHTPHPTRTPKTHGSHSSTTTAATTSTVSGGGTTVSTSSVAAPPPAVSTTTSAPASSGAVSGASTSSSSSGGAVVGPPGTGADVPFVSGFLMLLAGGGLLAGARRRRA
jgi:hypothetical protein